MWSGQVSASEPQRLASAAKAGRTRISRTWASVAFWKASKIFFSATVSLDFLSTALHTTPYACHEYSSFQRLHGFKMLNVTAARDVRAGSMVTGRAD